MPFLIIALAIGLTGLAGVTIGRTGRGDASSSDEVLVTRSVSSRGHARRDPARGGDKEVRRVTIPDAARIPTEASAGGEQAAQAMASYFDGAAKSAGVLSGAGGVGAAYRTESFELSRQSGMSITSPMRSDLRIREVPAPKKVSRSVDPVERYHRAASAALSPFTTAFNDFQQQAYATLLPVVTRQEWGARRPLARYAQSQPYRITVHHTEGHLTTDLKDSIAEARDIQAYHQKGRAQNGKDPFIDIGYHFLIDGEGRVIEGRPIETLGAHAGDANGGNIGIALMGNMDDVPPTAKQLDALRRLALFVSVKYGADPDRADFIEGHNHYVATACPGKHLADQLPRIRREVARESASIASAQAPLLASAR